MQPLKCKTCNTKANAAAEVIVTMFATIANRDNFECMKCFQKRSEKEKLAEEESKDYRQEETMRGMEDYESECTYRESQR